MTNACEYLLESYLVLLEKALAKEKLSVKYMKQICECMIEVILFNGAYDLYNWDKFIKSSSLLNDLKNVTMEMPMERRDEINNYILNISSEIKTIILEDKNNLTSILNNLNNLVKLLKNPLEFNINYNKKNDKPSFKI